LRRSIRGAQKTQGERGKKKMGPNAESREVHLKKGKNQGYTGWGLKGDCNKSAPKEERATKGGRSHFPEGLGKGSGERGKFGQREGLLGRHRNFKRPETTLNGKDQVKKCGIPKNFDPI